MFTYTFFYLQAHVQSIVNYLDEEFLKIVKDLWLLAIFAKALSAMLGWALNMFVISLIFLIHYLFTYYFIYFLIYHFIY